MRTHLATSISMDALWEQTVSSPSGARPHRPSTAVAPAVRVARLLIIELAVQARAQASPYTSVRSIPAICTVCLTLQGPRLVLYARSSPDMPISDEAFQGICVYILREHLPVVFVYFFVTNTPAPSYRELSALVSHGCIFSPASGCSAPSCGRVEVHVPILCHELSQLSCLHSYIRPCVVLSFVARHHR